MAERDWADVRLWGVSGGALPRRCVVWFFDVFLLDAPFLLGLDLVPVEVRDAAVFRVVVVVFWVFLTDTFVFALIEGMMDDLFCFDCLWTVAVSFLVLAYFGIGELLVMADRWRVLSSGKGSR